MPYSLAYSHGRRASRDHFSMAHRCDCARHESPAESLVRLSWNGQWMQLVEQAFVARTRKGQCARGELLHQTISTWTDL